ncbi:3-isopropylmalate dehydratase small subunit [bacterium]|nr:3-isopropylmalate dehydratase small subunit [bacterium]
MEPFKTHTGIVSLLDRGNIDTDQIISKEFLKSIKKTGFGESLFEHWKRKPDGSLNPDFELNNPAYKGTSILVAGNNFGCGSSREHAVWAIAQYGYKVVLAPQKKSDGEIIPGFADIFKNNSSKNGLLLIELSEEQYATIKGIVLKNPGIKATVNLENKTVSFLTQPETTFSFSIDEAVRKKLLEGLDDIGISLKFTDAIDKFEKTHENYRAAS